MPYKSPSASASFRPKSRAAVGLFLCMLLFVVVDPPPILAQTTGPYATGFPQWGTFIGDNVDTINVGNLNIHFVVPVFSKKGRGIDFFYNLVHDNAVLFPFSSGSGLEWISYGTAWQSSTPIGNGLFYGHGSIPNCSSGDVFSSFVFLDSSNTAHSWPTLIIDPTGACSGGSNISSDGWEISASYYNGRECGCIIASVTDPAGYVYGGMNAPQEYTSITRVTDPNGNSICETGYECSSWLVDTLGYTPITPGGQGLNATYSYPNPSGESLETVQLTTSSLTWKTNFKCPGVTDESQPIDLPAAITLPDGSGYSLVYESTNGTYPSTVVTGRIHSLTLPTGATITYAYSGGTNGINCTDGGPAILTKTTPDGTWTYNRSFNSSTNLWTTTVTDPAGDNTVYTFDSTGSIQLQRQVNHLVGKTQQPLVTQVNCYNGYFSNCSTSSTITTPITRIDAYTTPYNGKTSLSETYYANGLLTQDNEYDYGINIGSKPNSAPLQAELISYATGFTGYIINRPSCVQVTAGTAPSSCGTITSTTKSLHTYLYDSYGNVETDKSWVSGSNYLTKSYTYYSNGLPETFTDVNTTQTSFNYQNCNNTPAYISLVSTVGYLSSLNNSYTWDCNGAVVTKAYDANNQFTGYNYVNSSGTGDPFWRINAVTDPLNNIIVNSYAPATSSTGATQETALTFPIASPTSTVDVFNTFDGLGRLTETERRTSPSSTTFDSASQYTYGWNASGPFSTQTVAGGTASTVTQFDALGRQTSVTDGGGGTLNLTYVQNDVTRAIGPAPTGENLKRRQVEYDALGRISSVCEITTLPGYGTCSQTSSQPSGYFTKYTYDNPANSVTVSQNAQGTAQMRTFQYDGIGRLVSETNPETGTTTYTYDSYPSGTCGGWTSQPGDLLLTTYSDGSQVCSVHDGLHRLIRTGTSAASNVCRSLVYDSTSNQNVQSPPPGSTFSYLGGQLVEAETDNCSVFPPNGSSRITDEWFSYDADGHMTDMYQLTPNSGGFYHTTASYFANGAINTLSGVPTTATSWTYGLDGEGRPSTANYGTTDWVTATTYYPDQETYVNLGNGNIDAYFYDGNTGRMSGFEFVVGFSGSIVNGSLGWNPDWTLGTLGITDNLNSASTQNCAYTYDDLARGQSVKCTNNSGQVVWSQTFAFDPFGNIMKSGNSSFDATYLLSNGTTNNQEQSVGTCIPAYDGRGNLTKDCSFGIPYAYTWSDYNEPMTVNGSSLTWDALGREVEIANGSSFTQVLYSPIGKLGLMNGQSPKTMRFPLPGGSTAQISGANGASYVLHADWLGTSRIVTTLNNPSMVYDTAFAPYGENYAGAGTTNLDFTGQQQDTASGLYDFSHREYNPVQGRWLSPDPAGSAAVDFSNPQTWNRYTYVGNDPTSAVDPSGLCDVIIGGFTQTPGTADTQTQQQIASANAMDQAYPFSNLGVIGSFGAAYGSLGSIVAGNSILDAAAQSGGSTFNIYVFSGGAQELANIWSALPQDVQNRANIVYISPGRVPLGSSLPAGAAGFKGVGVLDSLATSLSPDGTVVACGHDANCEFANLTSMIANQSPLVDAPEPCSNPKTFTRANPNGTGNGSHGGGGGGPVGGPGGFPTCVLIPITNCGDEGCSTFYVFACGGGSGGTGQHPIL